MSPGHATALHRWRVIALVLVVVGGVALAQVGGTPAAPPPAAPSALVGAADAESSAWYCTGQSTEGGAAPGFLVLTNTTGHRIGSSVSVVSDSGSHAQTAVTLPPHAAVTPPIPAPSSGSWEAQSVVVSGGGVAVSQVVHGPLGWSEAPCASSTSAHWYFPGGSTSAQDGLDISLFNPASTPVVVDLSFVTAGGVVHPINFQGIVLEPDQIAVEDVAADVQQQPTVSTIVSTRTGRVVASEVQRFVGPSQGLALVLGAAAAQSEWSIPVAQESPGASTEIDVLNPGSATASVTVQVRLPSGPLAPITGKVAAGVTWVVATSSETRIPDGQEYSATVSTGGGAGVVVGRTVVGPSSWSAPQAGTALGVDGANAQSPTGTWVMPPPGSSGTVPVAGAAPAGLAVLNVSGAPETYTAAAVTASGRRVVGTGTLPASGVAVVSGSALADAGLDQIVVQSSGPAAVSQVAGPSGGIGVITMSGIPVAAPIGTG